MTRRAKAVLGAAAIALLVYGLDSWMKPEPGSRPWQIREFRKDSNVCGQFATKREDARKLLAWKPKPPWVNRPGTEDWKKEFEARMQAEADQSRSYTTEIHAMAARFQADELACLRGLDWTDVQIESLQKEINEEDGKRRTF